MSWPGAIIGGVAVIAHGFARATADIDLAVVAQPDDVDELLRIARRIGFRPRIAHAAKFAAENLVLLLEHATTGVPLDLSLALQEFERAAMARAVVRKIGKTTVRVAPLSALLVYKMVAARPKDLDDARALLATGAAFDREEVQQTLEQFDALLETNRAGEFRKLLREQCST